MFGVETLAKLGKVLGQGKTLRIKRDIIKHCLSCLPDISIPHMFAVK